MLYRCRSHEVSCHSLYSGYIVTSVLCLAGLVAQKLNEARVPVNSAVKLTFRRKYRKDGSDNYGVIPPSDETEGKESKVIC